MNQYDKTIEKSHDVIRKRIDKLVERINMLHEKYPEELFGLKADAMCSDYEEEIKDLKRYLDPDAETVRLRRDNAELADGIREARAALYRAEKVLRDCNEYKEADRIQSALCKLPSTGGY